MSKANSTLEDIAEKAVKYALTLGASHAEAYAQSVYFVGISLTLKGLEIWRTSQVTGIGLRVITENRLGFSCTTQIRKRDILNLAKSALKTAHYSEPNIQINDFPAPKPCTEVHGIYDNELAENPVDVGFDYARRTIEAACEAQKCKFISGELLINVENFNITNSLGVSANVETTLIDDALEVIVEINGCMGVGRGFDATRNHRKLLPEKIGREAAELAAKNSTRYESLKKGEITAILEPCVLRELFTEVLIPSISGDNIINQQSIFKASSLGSKVASEKITVIDDGTLSEGYGSCPVDGEGTPSRRTTIIDQGFLRNFLLDHYTASFFDAESTGNATRLTFKHKPFILQTNLFVAGGGSRKNELVEEADEGYFVQSLAGIDASPSTGDFTFTSLNAEYIRQGESMGQVEPINVASNLFELLNNELLDVSSETELVRSMSLPSMKFPKVLVF